MGDRAYIAIDLKSFYASVERMERGPDPMTTNLVVADKSRTDKTICLAVSPSLNGRELFNASLNIFVQEYQLYPNVGSSGNNYPGYINLIPSQ